LAGGRQLYRETIGLSRETGRLRKSTQRMANEGGPSPDAELGREGRD
jgi:hypothetical protein